MANNLGTLNGTTFYTSNMKPEADEQIDALWGQNMADTLMYLQTRRQTVITTRLTHDYRNQDDWSVGTYYFKKNGFQSTFYGSLNGKLFDAPFTYTPLGSFFINGTGAFASVLTASGGTNMNFAFSYDMSNIGTTQQNEFSYQLFWYNFDEGTDSRIAMDFTGYLE